MNYDFSDLARRLENLIRIGAITEVDYARARARVNCGVVITDWLPWLTRRAGLDADWWAPEPGEQVVVLAPGGLLEDGVILPSLYSDSHPEPAASAEIRKTTFANGASFTHDRDTGALTVVIKGPVTLTANGAVLVQAPEVTLDTPNTTCTGALLVQGRLTYQGGMTGSGGTGAAASITGEVVADGISLTTHTHTEQGDGQETSAPH